MSTLRVSVQLRWGDQDVYGHVNNVAIVRLLEEARSRGFWSDRSAIPLPPLTSMEPTWSLVSEMTVRYLAPLDYSDESVTVEMAITRIGGADFEIIYRVMARAADHVHAVARTAIVLVDRDSGSPQRLDPGLRAALLEHQIEAGSWSDKA